MATLPLSVSREGHWLKMCNAMGQPELAEDERFVNMKSRSNNIDEVDRIVECVDRSTHPGGYLQDNPGKRCDLRARTDDPESLEDKHMLAGDPC